MSFIDDFNMMFREILRMVGRLFPFAFCLSLTLTLVFNLFGGLVRWIRSKKDDKR